MNIGLDYIGVTVNFICHDGNGRVFWAKRTDKCTDEHNRWEPGGGKLDFGEDPDIAVVREMEEEFGITSPVLDANLGYTNLFREHNGKQTHWICLTYVFTVDPTEARICEPDKFSESGWFPLDEPPQPCHSAVPLLFKKFDRELRSIINKT